MLSKAQEELRDFLETTGCTLIMCEDLVQFKNDLRRHILGKGGNMVVITGLKHFQTLIRSGEVSRLGVAPFHWMIVTKKDTKAEPGLSQYRVVSKPVNPQVLAGNVLSLVNAQNMWKKTVLGPMQRSSTLQKLPVKKTQTRFLLVDDNEFVRKAITRQIRSTLKGCQIKECENGETALEEIEENHKDYDYVLMDVHMPVLGGIEATKRIREFESKARLRRIVIICIVTTKHQNNSNVRR